MKRFVLSFLMLAVIAFAGGQALARTSDEAANEGRITIDELKAKLAKGEKVVIIDVRGSDYDSSDAKIKGAIRIVPAELEAHLKELPRNKEIVTYCACSTDGGAMKARQTLLDNGFKNVHALKGGWNAWVQAGGPTEPKVQAANK
jgi:rhodanese-related sulfurtransferase